MPHKYIELLNETQKNLRNIEANSRPMDNCT